MLLPQKRINGEPDEDIICTCPERRVGCNGNRIRPHCWANFDCYPGRCHGNRHQPPRVVPDHRHRTSRNVSRSLCPGRPGARRSEQHCRAADLCWASNAFRLGERAHPEGHSGRPFVSPGFAGAFFCRRCSATLGPLSQRGSGTRRVRRAHPRCDRPRAGLVSTPERSGGVWNKTEPASYHGAVSVCRKNRGGASCPAAIWGTLMLWNARELCCGTSPETRNLPAEAAGSA